MTAPVYLIFCCPPPNRNPIALKQEQQNRIAALKQALQEKILVLDGATGTFLQDLNLTAEDFGGEEQYQNRKSLFAGEYSPAQNLTWFF